MDYTCSVNGVSVVVSVQGVIRRRPSLTAPIQDFVIPADPSEWLKPRLERLDDYLKTNPETVHVFTNARMKRAISPIGDGWIVYYTSPDREIEVFVTTGYPENGAWKQPDNMPALAFSVHLRNDWNL